MKPYKKDVFNVVAHGAVGDGKIDDSQAFLKAWTKLCEATTDIPTLLIPSEKTFLLNPVSFKGPCKSANPQVLGNIIAPHEVSAWNGSNINYWILFAHVDGLKINGSGQIDGKGSTWWKQDKCPSQMSNALRLEGCNGLQLSGLKHLNSQRNHISISGCDNVTISNVNIIAPEDSPNTDGIDISHSTHILIHNSFSGTGDDCVAINGGCSFINITNVACGPGHGISVGSLGAKGAHETVEEIHVHNCTFDHTKNGARIKTWQD
ncbi:Glycoside hydrolase [Macleaya cordata]|uniref:Glycoside hydrolase n=1 Tax=Macleaya cordata TaxID=56857 RepID=A0A200QHA0_MACCD|nr:Glycoside hydrolase [Macleaya cordata]